MLSLKVSGLALSLLFLAGGRCHKDEPKPATDQALAKGPDFTLPVPDGYHVAPAASSAAVIVAQNEGAASDLRLATIAVTAVPAGAARFDATDPAVCRQKGEGLSAASKGTLEWSGIVDGPTGKTCQMYIKGPAQRAIATVVKGNGECWVLTCDFDLRDRKGEDACKLALAGWKFQ